MAKKMNERKLDGREKAGERKKCLVDVGAFSSCMKPPSSESLITKVTDFCPTAAQNLSKRPGEQWLLDPDTQRPPLC